MVLRQRQFIWQDPNWTHTKKVLGSRCFFSFAQFVDRPSFDRGKSWTIPYLSKSILMFSKIYPHFSPNSWVILTPLNHVLFFICQKIKSYNIKSWINHHCWFPDPLDLVFFRPILDDWAFQHSPWPLAPWPRDRSAPRFGARSWRRRGAPGGSPKETSLGVNNGSWW